MRSLTLSIIFFFIFFICFSGEDLFSHQAFLGLVYNEAQPAANKSKISRRLFKHPFQNTAASASLPLIKAWTIPNAWPNRSAINYAIRFCNENTPSYCSRASIIALVALIVICIVALCRSFCLANRWGTRNAKGRLRQKLTMRHRRSRVT